MMSKQALVVRGILFVSLLVGLALPRCATSVAAAVLVVGVLLLDHFLHV